MKKTSTLKPNQSKPFLSLNCVREGKQEESNMSTHQS